MANVLFPSGDQTWPESLRRAEIELPGPQGTSPHGAERARRTNIVSSQDDSVLDVRKNSPQLVDSGFIGKWFLGATRRNDKLFKGGAHITLLHT